MGTAGGMSQESLEGLAELDGTHLSVIGASRGLAEVDFALGEDLNLTIKGHVVLVGTEVDDKGGVRRVVKVKADGIEVNR
jgi:hypothetical protein